MQFDTKPLREVVAQFSQLHAALISREYSKETIVKKIVQIEQALKKINGTTKEELQTYRNQKAAWQQQLQLQLDALQITIKNLSDSIEETVTAVTAITNNAERKPLPEIDPDELLRAFSMAIAETKQGDILLAENLKTGLAGQRRWLERLSWLLFRFNNIAARIISITCIISLAYGVEFLLELWLDKWSKYILALGIALISGFSFDRLVEKRADGYFWRNAGRWEAAIAIQLKLAADHMQTVQNFIAGI
jgi:hypothetical protein